MSENPQNSTGDSVIAPLTAEDLEAVIAIDRALSGVSRRGFFEKRLAAALEEPGDFVYVGLRQGQTLVGYALARLVEGEFGKPGARAVFDAIGVDSAHQGQSAGRKLLSAVGDVLRHKGVGELSSQLEWANQNLIGFFAAAGFAIAPRVVLTRSTDQPLS